MGKDSELKVQRIRDPLFQFKFKYFAPITVSLPLGALIFCFVYAMIFQFNEVNKTMCKVQNFIPSVSAVTGAAPGRYVWRTCIALHATPRFAVGFIYFNYWMNRLRNIAEGRRQSFMRMAKVTFWTYVAENTCLLMVSFIGNFENYPLHEKIFVVFMFTSLFHQLFVLILFKWAHPVMSTREAYSYKWKKVFFAAIMFSTACLIFFFILHRVFCKANAFTMFASIEYLITLLNIAFHYTGAWDLKGKCWIVANCIDDSDDDEDSDDDDVGNHSNENSNRRNTQEQNHHTKQH